VDDKFEFINLNDGADFLKWKERIIFMINIHDYHHALYEEDPRVPDENYVEENEKYDLKAKEWERSNNASPFIMKHTISFDIKNEIPDSLYTKEYMALIGNYFKDVLLIEDML
jgi:hypothetical protein